MLPLPHPSPRNNRWFRKNPWFENELLPELKIRVNELLRKTDE
jgi:uracil-DNA glycosylase